MQVDIRVPVGRPLAEIADVIARCEDAGFGGVGVHDHPHSGRDAYLVLALAAGGAAAAALWPSVRASRMRPVAALAAV